MWYNANQSNSRGRIFQNPAEVEPAGSPDLGLSAPEARMTVVKQTSSNDLRIWVHVFGFPPPGLLNQYS